jgi:hypothetical protein
MAEKEYERLTRARPRAKFAVISSGNSSLWMGKDHLLCIDTNGYTENYKRFYFRDIQAFLIRKTQRYTWWSLVTGVLAAGFLFPAAFSSEIVLKYILGIVGGLFSLVLVINLALGPSSACQLRTAVQIEELPSLNRLRRTRKVLDRLRPLIVAAQGALTPEEISRRVRELPVAETSPASGTSNLTSDALEDPNVPPRIV